MTKAVLFNIHNPTNRGNFLSAKIYADVKGNTCECGGKFTGRKTKENVEFPVCDSCKEPPSLFRISAKIEDMDGESKRVTIRRTKDKERLKFESDIIYTYRIIKRDLENGEFNVNDYQSKKKQENLIFKNFLLSYMKHHEKRYKKGQLTFEGLRDKKKSHKHLLEFFANISIDKIRKYHISKFEDNFEGTDNTLRKAKSELKTILLFAQKRDYITKVVDIGTIGKSRLREHTMTEAVGLDIIAHVNDVKLRGLMLLLTIYPVRPGEIRALKWENVDLNNNTITFDSHFSGTDNVEGRKSRKAGDKLASITLKLSKIARDIILKQDSSSSKNDFVFTNAYGNNISQGGLNKAWVDARKMAGYKPTKKNLLHMYELKHIRLSKMNEQVNGNLKILEEASGVDVKTLMSRYVRADKEKVNSFFN
jgi:integrase